MNKVLPPFLPKFRQRGCDEIFTTSRFDFSALAEISHGRVYSNARHAFCAGIAQDFFQFSISRRIFTSIRAYRL